MKKVRVAEEGREKQINKRRKEGGKSEEKI
jgi:hypothetical protein